MADDDGYGALRSRPVKHFGETLRSSKSSYRLKRHEYALPNKKNTLWRAREHYSEEAWDAEAWMYEDEDHRVYSDHFCELYRAAALQNFDANMAFFRQLSGGQFLETINAMLEQHPTMQRVTELSAWKCVEGVYVMVLDRYMQAYVGHAGNIRTRIMKHWSRTMDFDHLIFGAKETSVLPIDAFRALDTTRIFAVKTTRRQQLERRLVNDLPADFLLNRVPGGNGPTGGMFLPSEVKRRQLPIAPERSE
ncbi:hypothetical protein [Pseudarthrobacter sp. BRE9]|uniref:hypothetical protein n=1 Tax=Pseudarthrobacter sp. BRE9 TaxID=2962582 RepID=UPI002880E8B9|nr:hypothetical protein [Pseudarthrobacter sp. BRE9]MDT0168880.1 hypothetical protein [Pseudarthrobacter sp. BRE9]